VFNGNSFTRVNVLTPIDLRAQAPSNDIFEKVGLKDIITVFAFQLERERGRGDGFAHGGFWSLRD
jgi:hypothetical protein